MSDNVNIEYLTGVLNVTREQLSRAMGVCAELEALLTVERSKVEQLQAALNEAQAASASTSKSVKE
jgi:hypothetical protein